MNTTQSPSPLARVEAFSTRVGIRLPILLAPMAGACPPALSAAVANAGGMGACGAVRMNPESIRTWVEEFRRQSQGQFQLNLWIPDPQPTRDFEAEKRQREYLAKWGPPAPEMDDRSLPDFEAQCQAILEAAPAAVSSIMGLFPPAFVSAMKGRGILWFATVTTVTEARAAEAAGADAIIAQGAEAGGHRGAFRAVEAERKMVGLLALVPQVADAVSVPVIAAGGIADARAVAAALILGASAVQIGTGFLRSAESSVSAAYAERLAQTEAHDTTITRAFTGRPARCVANRFVEAYASPDAPAPAPYPLQRGFTHSMREEASKAGDTERMQMWAGQAAKFAQTHSAGIIAQQLWDGALRFFR